ncbi:AMP-binding protein [Nocardioides sp.]|uniref:AMP-binding protein n=1 Tax=Nocardioides sp. TaxID=35761 RepID=UPI0035161046
MSPLTTALQGAVDLAGGLRVLTREGLLEPTRPDRTLRAARETARLGPVTASIRLARRRTPDAVALQDGPPEQGGTLTYAQLDDRAAALAHRLLAAAPGSRPVVGLLARDHRGAVLTLAACGYAGARAVLLNTGSAAPQLAQVLAREGVDVVVHDEEFADVVAAAGAAHTLRADGDDVLAAAPTAAGPPPRPARSGGLVVLTSGTTGVPKGAPRQRVNPLQTAQVIDRLPFPRGAVVMMAAPTFHGTGLSQTCLAFSAGCRVVLPGRFRADAVAALVRDTRAEVLVAVPTMVHRLVALPDAGRDLATLRRIYVGGAALSPDLARRTHALLGGVLHNLYGSTEVGIAAVASPADLVVAPGCVGRPPVGARVRLLGPDRRPVAAGETGVIFVRSALAFSGYSDGTGKEVVDGYVSTGDLGFRDHHGLLHVVGREDDMIVSGGENVVPAQVEELLASHPDVDEVAVVGVPDEEFGQRLRAVVVPAAGRAPDPEALRTLAREQLARHEVPREVWVVDALPRNATGKILRRVLAAADTADELVGD